MKKVILVLAMGLFIFNFAQETPKGGCCAGKEKKECSVKDKKACGDNHKGCEAKTAGNTSKAKNKKAAKINKAA